MAKATFIVGSGEFAQYQSNIDTILGKSSTINPADLGSLEINYAFNLQANSEMLVRLRAMVELAEDGRVGFSMEDQEISELTECVRLLKDLKLIAEERALRSIWSEI